MGDLVTWLRQELTCPSLPIAACIAKLHHDFIVIHPFEDGNGRVGSLLVNYVLIRSGYLPLIVRTDEKEAYLTALRLADAGELSALMAYLQRRLEWSLQLGIKAAKGEGIEEPSDLEKEVAIFVRNQQKHKDKVVFRSPKVLRELFDSGLREFVKRAGAKLSKFTPLFKAHEVRIQPPELNASGSPATALERMIQRPSQTPFVVTDYFHRYLGKAPDPFDIEVATTISFGENRYTISFARQQHVNRLYTEPVLPDEAESLANKALAHAFAEIKKKSGSQE
jgi:hypothetical protein